MYLLGQEIDIGAILNENSADAGVTIMSGDMKRRESGSRLDVHRMILLKQQIRSSVVNMN